MLALACRRVLIVSRGKRVRSTVIPATAPESKPVKNACPAVGITFPSGPRWPGLEPVGTGEAEEAPPWMRRSWVRACQVDIPGIERIQKYNEEDEGTTMIDSAWRAKNIEDGGGSRNVLCMMQFPTVMFGRLRCSQANEGRSIQIIYEYAAIHTGHFQMRARICDRKEEGRETCGRAKSITILDLRTVFETSFFL